MSSRRPLLVVTLPARNPAEARPQIDAALEGGGDIAELRVDRWDRQARGDIDQMFPSRLPLMATLRSRAEGGEGPDDPEIRARQLGELSQLPFAFLDLERARDEPIVGGRSSDGSLRSVPRTVWSTHLRSVGDGSTLAREVRRPAGGALFVKVVAPASVSEFWTTVLPQVPPAEEGPFVLHTTGASAPLLRSLAWDLGLAAVYCALPERNDPEGVSTSPVEPGQIPVDRLSRHFSRHDGSPFRFAVIGDPVAHSRSPSLHSRWMADSDLPGLYVALEVASEKELAETLSPLAAHGFRGLSVTHPWKEAALRLSTTASRAAERCGCANMLTFREGQIEAENTDLAAMLRRLEELRSGGMWDGESLTVLGTGGAARATLAAAQELGAKAFVVGRNASRARELADAFSAEIVPTHEPLPSKLMVHATPAGRAEAPTLGFPADRWMSEGGYVLDYVYAPAHPFLSDLARANGATYEDGERLLLYQAAVSFEMWWDVKPRLWPADEPPEEKG